MTRRALVVCPGRGSYGRESLGSLQESLGPTELAVLDACDAVRTQTGRPTVRELDASASYKSSLHVAGEHASLLTFACSLVDYGRIRRDEFEIVGVTGNSMGWYTALAAAGALSVYDAAHLVETMGGYQENNVIGGQVMWPVVGDVQRGRLVDPDKVALVDAAIAACQQQGHQAWWSIRLGGFAILGADKAGVRWLLEHLPKEQRGEREYPTQLPLHSAFHTPLMAAAAERAAMDLGQLEVSPPKVPLIDGRGVIYRPHHADPADLLGYTLGHQVTEVYDFSLAVRTALRHTGADVVIALGPGNALGGPLSRILKAEGWGGEGALQPAILSFGVADQRARLLR